MNTWEHIFDKLTHEINPQTLKTKSAKSNISFAKKYCKTMPPKLITTCLQSIQQALSFSVIPEQKTKTILDILDALPFILHLAHHTVTTATAAEERSATLCFLLTRALATEENILDNGTTVIGQDHTPVEQAIRNGYITYRADQRSRQAAPQRVVAAVNSIIPTLPLTFAQSDHKTGQNRIIATVFTINMQRSRSVRRCIRLCARQASHYYVVLPFLPWRPVMGCQTISRTTISFTGQP